MCDIIKYINIRVMKVQGENTGKVAQKLSKEIMAKNLPNLMKKDNTEKTEQEMDLERERWLIDQLFCLILGQETPFP